MLPKFRGGQLPISNLKVSDLFVPFSLQRIKEPGSSKKTRSFFKELLPPLCLGSCFVIQVVQVNVLNQNLIDHAKSIGACKYMAPKRNIACKIILIYCKSNKFQDQSPAIQIKILDGMSEWYVSWWGSHEVVFLYPSGISLKNPGARVARENLGSIQIPPLKLEHFLGG